MMNVMPDWNANAPWISLSEMKNLLGPISLDWKIGYAHASEDRPNEGLTDVAISLTGIWQRSPIYIN